MCIIKENNKTRKKNLESKTNSKKSESDQEENHLCSKKKFHTVAKSNHDCTGADGGGVLSIYYAGTCNVMEGRG